MFLEKNLKMLLFAYMGTTERIKIFLEHKGISKNAFCKATGFANGFLDKNSNIGSDKFERIIEVFPDVNPEWLINGKGDMLRSIDSIQHQISKSCVENNSHDIIDQNQITLFLKDLLKEKEIEIKNLNQEIGQLKQEIFHLKQIIHLKSDI